MTPAKINGTTLPALAATPAPVINMIDGVPMADSRNVAAMFSKRHDNDMRDVRGLLGFEDTPCGRHFREATYVDPQNGQAYPHFLMDRDEFALVAMGFTGARATRWKLAYIEAFNRMEAELQARPTASGMMAALQDPATVLALIAHHAQETLAARAEAVEAKAEVVVTRQALAATQAVVEEAKPKVEGYDHLMSDEGTCCLADAARIIGAPQAPFFAWLRKRDFVFDKGEDTLPNARYRKEGYFQAKLVRVHRNRYREQTRVTRTGLDWLRLRWAVGPANKIEAEARGPPAGRPGPLRPTASYR
ncbi:phage regulatory protein/antirepressor Ant [Methylorubrum extorquens]|uniref:phage regulatory protein/antirepressor Ant n=1 Tax=Methylorubrum extorquens TaxID=408 RepID=UPI00223779E2|nr:phage regulatory protein/antirepressor Ant [Methylorubrum extorquens]UYW30364.1 phage regulatory protein/antirepressor Ant [Methylorubrum extorquens]